MNESFRIGHPSNLENCYRWIALFQNTSALCPKLSILMEKFKGKNITEAEFNFFLTATSQLLMCVDDDRNGVLKSNFQGLHTRLQSRRKNVRLRLQLQFRPFQNFRHRVRPFQIYRLRHRQLFLKHTTICVFQTNWGRAPMANVKCQCLAFTEAPNSNWQTREVGGDASLLLPNFNVSLALSSQISVFVKSCIMNTLFPFAFSLCQSCRSLRKESLSDMHIPFLGLIKMSYHGLLSMMTSS